MYGTVTPSDTQDRRNQMILSPREDSHPSTPFADTFEAMLEQKPAPPLFLDKIIAHIADAQRFTWRDSSRRTQREHDAARATPAAGPTDFDNR